MSRYYLRLFHFHEHKPLRQKNPSDKTNFLSCRKSLHKQLQLKKDQLVFVLSILRYIMRNLPKVLHWASFNEVWIAESMRVCEWNTSPFYTDWATLPQWRPSSTPPLFIYTWQRLQFSKEAWAITQQHRSLVWLFPCVTSSALQTIE